MAEDGTTDWMTIDQLVAWNIKTLREKANLSLREAAILMTIWHYEPWTYQRFYRRELAEASVTVAEMHAFANLFGVSLFRLLKRPRHVQFLQINGLLIQAEDYEPDYLWDVGGRTGEAQRVDPDVRAEIIRRSAARKARDGKVFAPGLYDDMTATGDLKSLAEKLEPVAEEIRQAAKKGKGNGDDQED
jgi:transcriptional regulator with XRE-family HTH domain